MKKKYIFILILSVHILLMSGHIFSPDEEILFRATQSLIKDFDFSINPIEMGFGTKTSKNGNEYPQYGIGLPIIATPFYLFGNVLSSVFSGYTRDFSNLQKINYSLSGLKINELNQKDKKSEEFLRLGISLFNSVIAAFAGVVLFILLRNLNFTETSSLMTVFLYSFATMALPHQRTFFTEPLVSVLILSSFLFLYKAIKAEENSGKNFSMILLAGCFSAYAILTRIDSIILITGTYIYILFYYINRIKENKSHIQKLLLSAIIYSLPIFVTGLILLFINKLRFGGFFSTGYEDQPEGIMFSTPLIAGLYGFLFSAGKGIFFFSPPLILSLIGYKKLYEKEKGFALGLLTSIFLFLVVMSKWQNWAGGWCWGPRHVFQIHLLLAVFIAPLFDILSSQIRRKLFIIFFILGLAVQILGSSVSPIDAYHELYRTPRTPPSFFALYAEDEKYIIEQAYNIYILNEEGKPIQKVAPNLMPAPINDSIYIPQNSQWKANMILLKFGRHDFFWIKLLKI